jgi:RNA methyltransferase, TrmH family
MLSRNQVKHIRSLHLKKFREEYGQFIAEGHKLVTGMLRSRFRVDSLYGTADWITQNSHMIDTSGVQTFEASAGDMEQITALSTPGPVLAVAKIPEGTVDLAEAVHSLVLMLDDIRDPGNLGTIIRIADWFGIRNVICSETTVDLYNPKVIQATMGSVTRVSVFYAPLAETLRALPPGTAVYGTFMNGEPVYTRKLGRTGIIVIGNESNGISANVQPYVTDRIAVPSFSSGSSPGEPESLNASIAAAIICSEFMRREADE